MWPLFGTYRQISSGRESGAGIFFLSLNVHYPLHFPYNARVFHAELPAIGTSSRYGARNVSETFVFFLIRSIYSHLCKRKEHHKKHTRYLWALPRITSWISSHLDPSSCRIFLWWYCGWFSRNGLIRYKLTTASFLPSINWKHVLSYTKLQSSISASGNHSKLDHLVYPRFPDECVSRSNEIAIPYLCCKVSFFMYFLYRIGCVNVLLCLSYSVDENVNNFLISCSPYSPARPFLKRAFRSEGISFT